MSELTVGRIVQLSTTKDDVVRLSGAPVIPPPTNKKVELPVGAIWGLTAFVYPDRLDCFLHSNEAHGWEATRQAALRLRAELDRILSEGSEKCPYAPKVAS